MYKDINGLGKISYSDKELSEKINLSESIITKYDKSLENKGVLSLVGSNKRDEETGMRVNNKIFHLDELGQAIIFTLQKHETKLTEQDKKIAGMEKLIKQLLKQQQKDNNSDKIIL